MTTNDYTPTAEELRKLYGDDLPEVDVVVDHRSTNGTAPTSEAATSTGGALHPWTIRDLLANPPEPVRPLVAGNPSKPDRPGFVDAESVALFYSAPKVGKSWLALELARAVASGHHFLGRFPVVTPGPVLYLDFEMSRTVWHHRWQLLERGHPVGPDIPLHVVTRRDDRALAFDPVNVLPLLATIREVRPVLIVVDTLRAAFDGDENDSGDTEAFVNTCREIGAEISPAAAVVLLHHATKAGGSRGSGAIFGAVDVQFELTKATDGTISLSHEGGRFEPPPPVAYRVEQVGEDGVRLAWAEAPDKFTQTRADDQRVWEVVRDLERDGTPATVDAVATVLAETPDPKSAERKAAERKLERLATQKRVDKVLRRFEEDGKVWHARVYFTRSTGPLSPRIATSGPTKV